MKKKMRQILDVLQDEKKLSEDEKILFAWSLAATPEQRWQRSQTVLRSLNWFARSKRKKSRSC
ncbi:MAG: hypothetical protein PHD76_04320 [Methylacidiphilales bacterium]|nr:hypothetical protein [Candidatus Methylacidiphilales bacterium]